MRIVPISKNLLGKLVYFDVPVFELNKLLDFQEEFTKDLEKTTSMKFSNPVIEPINPTKVLSKEHPTLGYKYGVFQNKSFDYLDSIGMGFGEKGYFYDVYLKFENKIDEIDIDSILLIIDEMNEISTKIEEEMGEYYFTRPNKVRKIEVSNFMMYLEFEKPIESIIDPKISSIFPELAKASEIIIPQVENNINFNFRLEFYPKIIEEGIVNIHPNDIIVKERILTFSRDFTKPKRNYYAVRMRGLPIRECFKFLNTLEILIG